MARLLVRRARARDARRSRAALGSVQSTYPLSGDFEFANSASRTTGYGVTSHPPRKVPVHGRLATTVFRPQPTVGHPPRKPSIARRARFFAPMGSLQSSYAFFGDDAAAAAVTPTSIAPAEISQAEWMAAMLNEQKKVATWQQRWVERDEIQRWVQIAATLSIPLAAAVWRIIFRGASRE